MTNAAAFNGGRSQINFNFPGSAQSGGEWWSNNLFKMFGRPTWTGSFVPTDFDANGYPVSNPLGQGVQWVGALPGLTTRPNTTFVLTWDGVGTMSISATGLTGSSGSLTSASSPGRYEFTISGVGTGCTIGITSWTSKISNMKLFFKDEESNLSSSYFNTDFKNKLSESKIAVYRFLNWQAGNDTNVINWSHRKSINFCTWGSSDIRPELYCSGCTGTNDYAVSGNVGNGATVPGIIPTTGDPADRTVVCVKIPNAQTFAKITGITFDATNDYVNWTAHGLSVNDPVMFGLNGATALPPEVNASTMYYVKTVIDVDHIEICQIVPGSAKILFSNAGTGSGWFATRQPTLALNGGTKIPIKSSNCISLGTGNRLTAAFYTFWYDDLQKSWIISGGTGAAGNGIYGFLNSVPYEVMISLCQEMGAHPWFSNLAPGVYSQSDFWQGLVSLCYSARQQTTWMIPRLECIPNEIFLFTALPNCLAVAQCYAIAYWQANSSWSASGGNWHAWSGMCNSWAAQVVYNTFYPSGGTVGGDTCPYQTINGVWIANFYPSTSTSHDENFTSALYRSTFSRPSADAASNWLTHNCCSMYFRSSYYKAAQETTWADDYVSTGNTANIAAYIDALATDSTADSISGKYTSHQNVAVLGTRFSSKDGIALKMNMYEGGYDFIYTGSGTTNVDRFRAAAKSHYKLYDYLTTMYKNFLLAGGEFPSCFQMAGPIYSGNSIFVWSVLEDLYQTPEPPQWTAIRLFNNRKRRIRW